jgi:hypothetical protein
LLLSQRHTRIETWLGESIERRGWIDGWLVGEL